MEKIKSLLKKITLRRLLLVIFLLIFNSYAWFIYATRVSNSITTHVVAWDIKLKAGEDEITNNVDVNIEKIYPGMEDYQQIVNAQNTGEISATVSYIVKEMTILGETYAIGDEYETDMFYTAEDLLEMLTDGTFPFEFSVTTDNDGEIEIGRRV